MPGSSRLGKLWVIKLIMQKSVFAAGRVECGLGEAARAARGMHRNHDIPSTRLEAKIESVSTPDTGS